ncbi:filamentous hemagglutinin N-terminal domain-containing protein [Nostoc sp. FACHB-888]|uniref:two-partner secretion domain-containing protein n=1 Tax=Nostoc sp. FACHB-888 TaxID=2692842 RepID=UPI001682273D|nr:filamentous hemagglutinin N-terminal domain-containing protein [Nostoc sp. FACHB-888]
MKLSTGLWGVKSSVLFCLLVSSSVVAQVAPDKTLPDNSLITNQANSIVIEGGSVNNSNLFHSFQKFSVPTGGTAFFNNDVGIQNIIARVTGGSISNIDGLIRTNGTANLFLINRNGIIFGQNARLNIGGSFFATTASSIKFADGFEFSAMNPQTTLLLTVSVPIGLQFTSNSGAIEVQGTGKGLVAPSRGNVPITRNLDATHLTVQPTKTLALIGSNITLKGGTITAEEGRIELGSVSSGVISLNPTSQGWALGYEGVSSFKDINLSQQSLVDTSGNRGGSIVLQGKEISLSDGSAALIQNQGAQSWESIKVNAFESLHLSGTSADGNFVTLLRTESIGSGNGGNIDVSTKHLLIEGGALIGNRNYGIAEGGNVNVNSSKSIELLGFSTFNPFAPSEIVTSNLTSGKSGNITVSTEQLLAQDGGQITSISLGSGVAGDITINANSIQLLNSTELINSGNDYTPSLLSSVAFSGGNAGNLIINASKFVVGEQATVNTSTIGSGLPGFVTINASDIEINGGDISSAVVSEQDDQQLIAAPSEQNGTSGQITINAESLKLTQGIISVRNQGTSEAGTLRVNSRFISLNNKSSINASTASGEGGDIFLTSGYLRLRDSSITATAGNNGNGGNIRIATNIITATDNNAITANAFRGRGGNIRIDTKGLFVSPDTQITASSERGINGTVEINVQDRNPSQTKVQPEAIAQTPEVVPVCQGDSGGVASTFVNTGAGGLATSSDNQLDNSSTWQRNSNPVQAIDDWEQSKPSNTEEPIEIVEAQGWILNADGDVVLTAQADPPSPYAEVSPSRCHKLSSTPPVSSITGAVRLK